VVAACGDDPFGTQHARGLKRDRPDGAGRAEDEHAVARSNRRPPGDGQPAGDAGYSARGRDGVIELIGYRYNECGREVGALDEEAVPLSPPPFSEQVYALPVATSDRLAARHVGEEWMAAVEATGRDGEIERVESDCDDLDRTVTVHLH
jgi:hypothetical protein